MAKSLVSATVLFFSAFSIAIDDAHTAETVTTKISQQVILPRINNQAELRSRVSDYVASYEKVGGARPDAIARDPVLYRKLCNLRWAINRALAEKKALDLSEFGFTVTEGGYAMNQKDGLQWFPLDSFVSFLLEPGVFASQAAELQRRGFRDQDVDLLRAYAAKPRPEQLAFFKFKESTESFARTIQMRRRSGLAVTMAEVQEHNYKVEQIYNEANREWAVGLLDILDKQRQRILMSYFEERNGSQVLGTSLAGTTDESTLAQQTVDYLASGKYVEDLARKEAEIRTQMEQ
jgi:hypothetical protein